MGGSNSLVTISGSGSQWLNNDQLTIGQTEQASAGAGFLFVTSGGLVSAVGTTIYGTGTLGLGENGTLNSPLTVEGGTLTLEDGELQTVTFTNPVTIEAGSILGFEVGNGSDEIALSGAGSFSVTGPAVVNLYGLSGLVTSGTYALISATTGDLSIGNIYNGGNFTYSLLSTSTSEEVIVTPTAPLTTAYWKGTQDNIWSILVGGTASNWTTNAAGTMDPQLTPSTTTDVIFSASNDVNESDTVLGTSMTIDSLTIDDTNAVSISGSDPDPWMGTDTLTVTSGSAVTINGGAGPVTISSNLYLSSTVATVKVTGTDTLLLSGSIGSSEGITKSGSGTLIITGSAYSTGGNDFVNKGTLIIEDGGYLSDSSGQIGATPTAKGAVTVTGTGSEWKSDDIYVGILGTGTLLVTNGGVVSDKFGRIGLSDGYGTVTVSGSGSDWTNETDLFMGEGGSGSLQVTDGGMVSSVGVVFGFENHEDDVVTVSGSGSRLAGGGVTVGFEGDASLMVTGGGEVSDDAGYVSGAPTSVSSVTISGSGSLWANGGGDLMVSGSGIGTLSVANGGQVSDDNTQIAYYAGSIGLAEVLGTGSTWTNSGIVYIGGNSSGPGGTGLVYVTDGAVVTATETMIYSTGTLAMGEDATYNSPLTVSGGALTLVDGQLQTVTLTNPISLAANSSLDFDVGNGSDEILLTGSGALAFTGTAAINLYGISGMVTSGTFPLISATSSYLALGKIYNTGNFTYSLAESGTSTNVVVTATTPLTTAYWKGGSSNIWSVLLGSGASNWTTDSGGTTDPHLTPSATTDVIFSASGDANEKSTVLGTDMTINSLTLSDTSAVTISGSDPNPWMGDDTLTISGSTGNTGITLNSGAGKVTISADLYLAGDSQTVTVNNAPGMVVSGTVGGTDGLIKSGTGGLTLSGVGNYGGATTLNNGDLVFSGSVCNTSAVNVLGGDLEVDGSSNIAAPVNLNGGELSGRGIVGPIASNNGTVSPGLTATGTTVGVLTVGGNVNLSGSTTFSLRLGVETGGDHDMLSVTGGGLVSLDDPPLQIVAGGSLYNSSNIGLTYIIISGGAAETGTGADVFSYDGTPIPDDGTFSIPGGYDFELVYGTDSQGSDDMGTGSNVDLVLEGIPEPRTWEMVAGGVVLLWACRRRFGITTRR